MHFASAVSAIAANDLGECRNDRGRQHPPEADEDGGDGQHAAVCDPPAVSEVDERQQHVHRVQQRVAGRSAEAGGELALGTRRDVSPTSDPEAVPSRGEQCDQVADGSFVARVAISEEAEYEVTVVDPADPGDGEALACTSRGTFAFDKDREQHASEDRELR